MAKDFATIISDINNQEEEAIRETDGNDFKEWILEVMESARDSEKGSTIFHSDFFEESEFNKSYGMDLFILEILYLYKKEIDEIRVKNHSNIYNTNSEGWGFVSDYFPIRIMDRNLIINQIYGQGEYSSELVDVEVARMNNELMYKGVDSFFEIDIDKAIEEVASRYGKKN